MTPHGWGTFLRHFLTTNIEVNVSTSAHCTTSHVDNIPLYISHLSQTTYYNYVEIFGQTT